MSTRKMILPASREDWLKLRHQYVSSTETAGLFGLSSYVTPFQLAVEKTSTEPPSWEGNDRTTWGVRLQDSIGQGVSEDYGVKVRRLNSYAAVDELRMGASFDMEIVGLRDDVEPVDKMLREMYRDLGPGILEIKTVDRLIYREQWKHEEGDEAPPHIEVQVQHQLDCIDRRWAAIGALVGGNDLRVFVREVDQEVCARIREKVRDFWSLLKRGEMPPPVLPQDVDIIRQLYLSSDPTKVYQEDNPELLQLCTEYADAVGQRKYWEDLRKTHGAKILTILGDHAKGVVPGYTIQANTVEKTVVPSYERAAYRNLVVRQRK